MSLVLTCKLKIVNKNSFPAVVTLSVVLYLINGPDALIEDIIYNTVSQTELDTPQSAVIVLDDFNYL